MSVEKTIKPQSTSTERKPRRRWARGPARPHYLQASDVDQVMSMLIALMSEVSALRDRIDTHELLAAQGVVATGAALEAFVLTDAQRVTREARRQAMLKRVLRVVTEQREAAHNDPKKSALASNEK
jgi:hypothetical protein